jgi:hypothetical protein
MRYKLTLTEQLLRPLIPADSPLWKNSWEVGRLVLAPEYRCGQDLLKHCLFHTLDYLCQNAEVGNLHASCSHVLSRLYRRFGFTVLEKNVLLEGTEKTYTLIHGHPPVVLAALGNRNTQKELAEALA